ncbi:LPXTG cell wall anchor domain-containing protein [uncultured Corynebacterium sp.]|uniref:LPXTG cell wall anchor domain-containing protein n=1 Tax=uncultured Corynebacterium sp. TaxID=159447 RepID=UPI00262F6149|nr:LPXTG cell wall anchor domain-containing protein [uncultured Corynebacterium sp.]
MQDYKLYRKTIATLATILMVLASLVGGHTSFAWAQDEEEETVVSESTESQPEETETEVSEPAEKSSEKQKDTSKVDESSTATETPSVDEDAEATESEELEMDIGSGPPAPMRATRQASDPRLIDGDWRDLPIADNPSLPQRCGLNIALVFDLSNSIGENGLGQTRRAGREVVGALAGTPTTVGLYNFGTNAPVENTRDYDALDLQDPDQVNTALRTVANYTHGGASETDAFRDWGGTNWEGALKNVKNSGVKYDVVYFITDGAPTTNDDLLPRNVNGAKIDGWTGDAGRITHNYDITSAIKAANEIKNGGTRIEALAVGNFHRRTPVLKDDVGYGGDVAWVPFTDGSTYVRADYADIPRGQFRVVRTNPDLRYAYQEGVGKTLGNYYVTESGNPYYFRLEDEVASTPVVGSGWSYNVNVANQQGTIWSKRVPAQGYSQVYAPSYNTAIEIMGTLVGPGNDGLHEITNYNYLTQQLKDAATETCAGTLTVQKQIVDSDGNVLQEKVPGWKFEGYDLQGDLTASLLDGTTGFTGTTNDDGEVVFKFKTAEPHKNGTISIREIMQDGFSIHQQDGLNAKCESVDLTDPNAVATGEQVINDPNDSLGFNVGIGTGKAVHCIVQNQKGGSFHVAKTPHEDQDKDTDGNQPKAPVKNGEVTAYYDISVTNNSDDKATLKAPVIDTVTFPDGMTIKTVEFEYNGDPIDATQLGDDHRYEFKPEIFGEFKGNETKQITVKVTARVDPKTQKSILDGTYQKCESANPSSPDNPRSMFNAVSLEGEVQEPDPVADNQACVDPELEPLVFSVHKVDADNQAVSLDGARFTVYPASVTDFGASDEGIELVPVQGDNSRLKLPEDAKLLAGKYKLVETKAPNVNGQQYSLLPNPIVFELKLVDGRSVVEIDAANTGVASVDDNDASIITVANVYSGKLPKTGGIGVGVVALIGLVIVSAGVYFARRGNSGQD